MSYWKKTKIIERVREEETYMCKDIQAYYDFYNVDKLFLDMTIVEIVVEDFVEFFDHVFVRS
jgi:hypothetical protein